MFRNELLYEIGEALIDASTMEARIKALEIDRDYYKNEYNKLLESSLQHGQQMMGNFLKLALSSGEKAMSNAFEDENKKA